MAKKLFAFLGIGDYKSVEYYFKIKKKDIKQSIYKRLLLNC